MSNIQFIEMDGKREYAVIPMDLFERIAPTLEELEDAADLMAFQKEDKGFRIPAEVANAILDGTHPIKAWRSHRKLTQDQLAEQAGISKPYLSQIENRKREGALKSLRAIARVLGVTVDDLEDEA
jgi:DNA-binding XRE family transcriptional regulator